jgi:pimeloyl-ACP methyl ester carboxylesterase
VPRDHERPDDGDVSLAVVRLPATDSGQRIGSLVVNPGGPGGSGVRYARAAERVITANVRNRFDIVGFDPRGVAMSEPVDCLSDAELDTFLAIDGSPDTARERKRLVTEAREFAAGCGRRSGQLLPHLSTADAARDMDVLREALGEERLTYLGKSYGTLLGATYAELFPRRVGRLVLDGAIDPTLSGGEIGVAQAEGFEGALRAFVQDCQALEDCPLRGGPTADVDSGVDQVADLLAEVDRAPLPGEGDRELTQSLALLGVVAALYDEANGWPVLRLALGRAFDGDGSVLLTLADFYTERQRDGSYTSNQNEATYAVTCLDRAEPTDVDAYAADARDFARRSPLFGAYVAWSTLPCASWPAPPVSRPHPIRAPGAAPILVVGTVRDPATPYVWAQALAEQLESGVLLSYDGDGHTAYARGSECIDDAVERYLIDGEVPPADTVCEPSGPGGDEVALGPLAVAARR